MSAVNVSHSLDLDVDLLGQGMDEQQHSTSRARIQYLVVIRSRNVRIFDETQGYAKVIVPSPANGLADVECREQ